jgi:molybdate transport repressor ModE-like protein
MLDIRRLRVLSEVARHGSLAAAAQDLSYTGSAVSQQIAALEREVGTRLLERRARGVVLTEAGRTLVAHAGAIFAALEAAETALAELADLRRGHLRMASFATAAARVLPPALDLFRARHPGLEVTVEQASPREGVARLREGRLDLALTVDVEPSPADGVEVVRLFDDPFSFALHRDHPLAAKADLTLADLATETWIEVPEASSGGRTLREACARVGFTPRVAFESDDYAVILELVRAGVGVALIPALALRPPQDLVVLRPVEPEPLSRAIQVATRPATLRSPAAGAMLDILVGRPPGPQAEAQLAAAVPPSR